ncbi:hypothetical protein BGX38DRAFT_1268132 [Terfezia claveryi]|nr:hypothetical protein BGX38DRAFT_1268132 [Terfezia claveryi]
MATVHRRRRDLIASRRPVAEEGEEGGEDYGHELDDSLSDDSGLSEDEEEDEDDYENLSEDEEEEEEQEGKAAAVEEGVTSVGQSTIEHPPVRDVTSRKTNGTAQGVAPPPASQTNGPSRLSLRASRPGMTDTDFMLNRLKIDDQAMIGEEVVDFDDEVAVSEKILPTEPASIKPVVLPRSPEKTQQLSVRHESPFERRRREHEEYKKKRDADPAFVPNRGAFFMHDHRHQGGGSNGFKPFGRGGRGSRGACLGEACPLEEMHHQNLSKPPGNMMVSRSYWPLNGPKSTLNHQYVHNHRLDNPYLDNSRLDNPRLDSSHPGKNPYDSSPAALSQAPLRRDKPVRISIPDQPIKYIYPHHNRSFVFIPRAMRPGGSGFIGGGIPPTMRRGGLQRGPTRSIYAGSVATQSAAMSRRSSFQLDITTQPASPAQAQSTDPLPPQLPENQEPSTTTEDKPTQEFPKKPVVKLPPSTEPLLKILTDLTNQTNNVPSSPANKPAAPVTVKPPLSYPTPAPPIHDVRGTPIIPMHQPRPQKTVSVADIETPVSNMHYATNPCMPPHPHGYPDMNNGTVTPANGYPNNIYTHSRHPSYQSQPPTTGTPLSQLPDRAIHAQPFQPNCNSYVASPLPNETPTAYHSAPVQQPQQTIAQESGGTVYFYDPSTYYAACVAAQGSYGAPLTPAPEQGMGVPSGGTVYYYPPQGTVYYQ